MNLHTKSVVDTEQGVLSEEFIVIFAPGDPIVRCELAGTSIRLDAVPPVGVALHPECLPVPLDGGN